MPNWPAPLVVRELRLTTEALSAVLPALQAALHADGEVLLTVPDPNAGVGRYPGEITAAGVHRPLSVWVDLADALGAHLLTPERVAASTVRLHLRRYAPAPAPDALGYGPDGDWSRVNKLEDPVFLLTFVEALRRVNPPPGGRILALGINAGRELEALSLAFPQREHRVLGLDLNAAALAKAQVSFPAAQFAVFDVNNLPNAEFGQFDLIVALSLLQSPGVQPDVLLAALCKHHLTVTGGLVLGFPNVRYRDGHPSYGARMRNFARPDFSLLMADVTNARRNLHKRGFKVFVTGKDEVLVTAIPAAQPTPVRCEWTSD